MWSASEWLEATKGWARTLLVTEGDPKPRRFTRFAPGHLAMRTRLIPAVLPEQQTAPTHR